MNITILHLFPDLMNLYGDWGNVAILRRTLETMGHDVTVVSPNTVENVYIETADMIYMGAGMERRSLYALELLRPYGKMLQTLVEQGVPMVFCGTAMDLLGATITDEAGTVHDGLGVLPFTVTHSNRRLVGDVMGDCPVTDRSVVGYLNSCSVVTGIETPLLSKVTLGNSHGAGLLHRNVMASPLTGPLLVKNPELLRYVITTLLTRKGVHFEAVPLSEHAMAGHEITVEALKNRISEKNS
ncbi:hypothetical protein RFF05_10975 [Bengtsoniella intestinalis]|uniref:hypothetical protein n=1 Tax=Bengtsoniella intestinalis TaxID=3073143 RepID=UPI00391F7673